MKIRKYKAGDEAAIRQICCDSAWQGVGLEKFFSDRELMAGLFTDYYVKHEPESLFVAEEKGKVIGYIAGSIKPRWFRVFFIWEAVKMFPRFLFNYFFKYKKRDRQFVRDVIATKFPSTPSRAIHFHRNVTKTHRKGGVGSKLKKTFFHYAKRNTKIRKLYREVFAWKRDLVKYYEDNGYKCEVISHRIFLKEAYNFCAVIDDFTKDKTYKK